MLGECLQPLGSSARVARVPNDGAGYGASKHGQPMDIVCGLAKCLARRGFRGPHMKTTAIIAAALALVLQAAPALAGPPTEASEKEINRMLDLVASYPGMGPTQFFTMKQGDVVTVPFMADATIEYYINGICDDDCPNIDLLALEADGTDADTDDADDPSPVLKLHAPEYRSPLDKPTGKPERPLTIEIRMIACKTDICTLGLRIAQVEDWK